MNDTQQQALRRYRLAYAWANGDKKARALELSYSKGWYTVTSGNFPTKVRREELERMTQALLARPRFQE